MTPESQQKLRHFKIVDCAVRSARHFYLMASHIHQLDDDCDDPDGEMAAAPDPETDLREAIRVAVYFPDEPDEEKWAFRTLRNIEFMHCAVATTPVEQLIGVSLDGQVYALGNGVSELEPRIDEHRLGPLRGSVRQVLAIDGMVYAVQANRGLCRRTGRGQWESLCAQLPVAKSGRQRDSQGFACAAGTSARNIYCAGGAGDLWHYGGTRWVELGFPAGNALIEAMCCATASDVYISCRDGSVYRGSGDAWRKISEGIQPCRSMVAYQGQVWCASGHGLSIIDGNSIARADVPEPLHAMASVLSAKDGILLAAGSGGAAYFDGTRWTEILHFR